MPTLDNDLGLVDAWPKRCKCGREHSLDAWRSLEYVGYMADDVESIELRNCPCGSTIAQGIEVSRA